VSAFFGTPVAAKAPWPSFLHPRDCPTHPPLSLPTNFGRHSCSWGGIPARPPPKSAGQAAGRAGGRDMPLGGRRCGQGALEMPDKASWTNAGAAKMGAQQQQSRLEQWLGLRGRVLAEASVVANELWPSLLQLRRYSRTPAPKERSARPQGGRVGETSPGKPQLRQGCAGYRRANFSAHNSRPQLPLRRVLPSPPGRAGGMRGPILEAALAAKARWPSLSCCRNRPAHPPLPVAASARWRPLLQLRK
jgi:hypothetical protein